MIYQKEITVHTNGRGYHLITQRILDHLDEMPEKGLLHLFVKHTSAGLTLNENADPSVRVDFESFMNELVPENHPVYTHTLEGPDDMPAHLKASLIGNELSVPITDHKLNLGTWQGVYLCEFRNFSSARKIVITVYS
ncbi:MAG: secondary thiamine-phosphate synthase enzyme YjbQ [Bacteroidales bacterium]|nr:secondary thiamine-phosphate synthase enzyme YjbQ [Bacteroidales bacterium]